MDGFFGDFLAASALIMIYAAVIFGWVFSLFDMFARGDLKNWQKALWFLAILALPIIGVIVYIIARPGDARWFSGRGVDPDIYTPRDQQIAEITTLVRLRDQGTITDDEYNRMKERVMTETPAGFPPPAAAV